jgi:ubiquinone/menaquinone biosynthesis C-methylase UbiE
MQDFTRVSRPEAAAASYYSSLAPWYDILAGSEKRSILAGVALLDPKPGERILEIGFGTGYAQVRIARAVGDGFCAGVDLSFGMARIAQARLHRAELASAVGLVCGNSLPLPFPADSFNGLFSSFTFELFDSPRIPELLLECRRVLKAGGRLVVVSLSKDQPLPWAGRLYEALHNRYPRLLDCRPIPVRALLEKEGFRVGRFEVQMMWGLPVALAEAWLLT